MPFCCGKRFAGVSVVLDRQKSPTIPANTLPVFFKPVALWPCIRLASPFPHNEALLTQSPRRLVRRWVSERLDEIDCQSGCNGEAPQP